MVYRGDGKITLNLIISRQVMRMGCGWNRLRIVSSGGAEPPDSAGTVLSRVSDVF
jgi:hypothetical protein